MNHKLKKCDKCNQFKVIWKNSGGLKFCKICWNKSQPKSKPTLQKKISPRSSKRIKQDAEYSLLRKQFLNDNPICQANLPGICTIHSTDCHHMAGRSGNLFLDKTYWKSFCRPCHNYIEVHPVEAKEMGLSINRLTK